MKIMSFNTQHCQSFVTKQIDFDTMAKVIRDIDPDIVGLNEMRGKGVDPEYTAQTEALAARTGLPHSFFAKAFDVGGENPYGNAVLSKHAFSSLEVIPIPLPTENPEGRHYEPRCVLKAKTETGLTLLITHFGLCDAEARLAVSTLLSHIADEKCVLMGDFNLRPDSPILLPIREKMKDTADLFSSPLLSFPSDSPSVKIDYIFVSSDIEVVEADIPPIVASDHRPHTAHINVN